MKKNAWQMPRYRPPLPAELELSFARSDTRSAVAYSLIEQAEAGFDALLAAEMEESDSVAQSHTAQPYGRQDSP